MIDNNQVYILLSSEQYHRMPWKNGLGETLEIVSQQDEDGICFRISKAAVVENGWFSDFEHRHRTLVLLDGNGMSLKHMSPSGNESSHHLVRKMDIAYFSGGDRTYASLIDGPINDLNIMVREGAFSSKVAIINSQDEYDYFMRTNDIYSGFYANDRCELQLSYNTDNDVLSVQANTTVQFSKPVKIKLLNGCGVTIVITKS